MSKEVLQTDTTGHPCPTKLLLPSFEAKRTNDMLCVQLVQYFFSYLQCLTDGAVEGDEAASKARGTAQSSNHVQHCTSEACWERPPLRDCY
uniref:Uncharacterized protein n=1 Tax=Anguilla anguilla TaxID=7936 RepID=A0A0E9WTB6_ANGAN